MDKEKYAIIEALIRYYLIEINNYNNVDMFKEIDAILYNLNIKVIGNIDFKYDAIKDKNSQIKILQDLLLSYENSDSVQNKEVIEEHTDVCEVCEVCECSPCDCDWGC